MIRDWTIEVTAEDVGQRLDAFLVRRVPTTSRALVIRAIESARVRVNERPGKKGQKLAAGDRVAVEELMEAADWRAAPNASIAIPVLHAEEHFLVIEKPPGLPVHPLDPAEVHTVVSGLLAAYPELAAVGPDPLFPAVVHRLDADTSGLMLVARDSETYEAFRRQFKQKEVSKRYIALVCGKVEGPARLEHQLVHAFDGPHRMVVIENPVRARDRKPMRAVTEYGVRQPFARHTLLDVTIYTGVTHQVRCQLAAAGHPIAGDRLYGSPEADAGYAGRLFLHAAELSFLHPVAGDTCTFRSELPEDLREALANLVRF